MRGTKSSADRRSNSWNIRPGAAPAVLLPAVPADHVEVPARSIGAQRAGTVYLLHFSGPTEGRRHYLGWSRDVTKRFDRHRAGWGAVEVKKALREGLKVTLAQTWRGTLADERRIKDECKRVGRGYACLCPSCGLIEERAANLVRGMGPATLRVLRAPPAGDEGEPA